MEITMEITFLGTSGSGVTKTRNLPSILIDRTILIDCGEGCLQSLRKLEIPLEQLSHIFISHFHADHLLGLLSIFYAMAFYDKISKLPPVYIPNGMKKNLLDLIRLTYSSNGLERTGYSLDIHELPIKQTEPLTIQALGKKYVLEWMKTIHEPICYAFKINDQIVYSGDTAPMRKMSEFSKGCKILIHEASLPDDQKELAKIANHSTPSNAAELARKSEVDRLILFHFPNLTKIDEEIFLQNALKIFPGIELAVDLESIFV
jgi:ribonuclease Z